MTRKPFAFNFWQSPAGHPVPGYIQACLDSQRRNLATAFEVVEIRDGQPSWALADFPFSIDDIALNSQGASGSLEGRRIAVYTGVLRCFLLARYGGLWVDADTVALPGAPMAARLMDHFDFITTEGEDFNLLNGILAAPAGSRFAALLWQRVHERVARGEPLVWGEIGGRLIRALLLEHPEWTEDSVFVAPFGMMLPMVPEQRGDLYCENEAPDLDAILHPHALFLSLYNNGTEAAVKAVPAAHWRDSPSLLGQALRRAEAPTATVPSITPYHALNRARLWRSQSLRYHEVLEQRNDLKEKLSERTAQYEEMRGQRNEFADKLKRANEVIRKLKAQTRAETQP